MEGDDVIDPETTIALKRVEFDEHERANFCFEIKAGTFVVFALTIPVVAEPNDEPNQTWPRAHEILFGILHEAAQVAMKLAQVKPLTPEELFLRRIFEDRPPDLES
jgi:hypothetical protein